METGRSLAIDDASKKLKPARLASLWENHRTAITRTIAVAAFLGLWEWAVRGGGVNPLFLSSPILVARRLAEVFTTGFIWPHMQATFGVAVAGFLLSAAVGVPLGVMMGRSRLVRDTLEPFVMAKYSSPTVAFIPLLILWMGIGMGSKVALVFLGAVFVIIINTEAGVSSVDRRLIETAKSFCANEAQILAKVIGPAALPFIVAGFRLSIGRVLIMVVVAEFYASTAGLGFMMEEAAAAYDTTTLFVGVVILAAAGVTLNSGLRALELRIAPWVAQQTD